VAVWICGSPAPWSEERGPEEGMWRAERKKKVELPLGLSWRVHLRHVLLCFSAWFCGSVDRISPIWRSSFFSLSLSLVDPAHGRKYQILDVKREEVKGGPATSTCTKSGGSHLRNQGIGDLNSSNRGYASRRRSGSPSRGGSRRICRPSRPRLSALPRRWHRSAPGR